jgi:superfamily II DNA or RNA helicase
VAGSSSDGYTANAKTIAKRNDVLLLARNDLDLSAVSLPWPKSEKELRSWLAGKAPVRKAVKPRLHQRIAIKKAVSHLASPSRGQLVMACGTGKTLTALWIKERIVAALPEKSENARVVVLVPSINLLAQTLQAWAANRNSDWKRLAVCSDATAGSSRDENFEDMAAVDAGFEVTTDRKRIREFLRETRGEQIIFSTYQSSAEVAAAARAEKLEFDLVICDEAHRLAGQVGKNYASILSEKVFPARRRLFMTATPKVFTLSTKKKARDEGYAVASMDDPEKFGGVAYELPFGKAIKKGLLTDYQVVIAVTTDTKAKELLEENRFVGLDGKTMTAADLAAAIAVAKAAKRHETTRVISFHSTIKRSKQFVDTLEQICAVKLPGVPRILEAGHVDGSVSAKERQRRLDRLKEGTTDLSLLSNSRCLTEGVDVPSLDGVAFVDPRQSEVDIVQAVGRAIRLSPKKELGTIIVPVVCSAEEAAEGKLDAAGHKKLRQVLWALRDHDASLAVEIDDFVFAQALSAGKDRTIGIPEKVIIEFDSDELKGFAAGIRTSILKIGSPDAEWAERYSKLKAFCAKHNRWPAQSAAGDEGELAKWISHQRVARKNNKLSPERVKRLEDLPGWSWDPLADAWDQSLDAVSKFRAKHKRWPAFQAPGDEGELAAWIGVQRVARRKNKLSLERTKRLELIPGWSWDPFADAWDQSLDAVRAFRAKHKRWPAYGAAGVEGELATWIGGQRTARKKNKLSPERTKRLEKLPGWSWDPIADAWDQNFDAVRAFRAKHKHWPVGRAAGVEGELATWIGVQRRARKNSKLSLERTKRLEKLPGWVWSAKS